MGMGHEHHLSLPMTHTAHLACNCGPLAYLILWLVVQSDPVNIVESCGCGGGCGHCGNDVMEACMTPHI